MNTSEEIKDILKKYTFDNIDWKNIENTTDLKNDLRINSARIVDIVLDIEDKYNIAISDSEIEKMKTIDNIVEIVSSKIK